MTKSAKYAASGPVSDLDKGELTPLDTLDVKILRELMQTHRVLPAVPGLRPSYRNIARKLKVAHNTVRTRIKGMYETGVITGSSVYPNPNLLGLRTGAYAVEVSPALRKPDVVRELASVEGVMFLHNFHGALVGLGFVYENREALQGRLAEFKRISGSEIGVFTELPHPPCPEVLTPQETRLVRRFLRMTSPATRNWLGRLTHP